MDQNGSKCATDKTRPASIFTDSQYAVQAVQKVADGTVKIKSHDHVNGDILRELQDLWQTGTHTIHKIKAHRE